MPHSTILAKEWWKSLWTHWNWDFFLICIPYIVHEILLLLYQFFWLFCLSKSQSSPLFGFLESWVVKKSNTNEKMTNPFNIRSHSVLYSKRQQSQINFKHLNGRRFNSWIFFHISIYCWHFCSEQRLCVFLRLATLFINPIENEKCALFTASVFFLLLLLLLLLWHYSKWQSDTSSHSIDLDSFAHSTLNYYYFEEQKKKKTFCIVKRFCFCIPSILLNVENHWKIEITWSWLN